MTFADFHFIRPYSLLALLPTLILIVLLAKNKLARGQWSEVCDDALLPFILQDTDKNVKRSWSSIALSFSIILAIIALAGPVWERLPTPVFRNDAAVVIVLDLSRSMNASDIKPSRLIRARYKVADILQQRKDGLTALVVYAGDAFTVAPLTTDTDTITNQLTALTTDLMPSQGSNTLAALKQAADLLQQAGQTQGAILVISDGVDPRSLTQSSEILGNYTLSILGIGTAEGAPVKLADGGFLKDQQGNIVVPRLAISTLRSLAQSNSGVYQTISNNDSDIKTIMATINRLATAETMEDNEQLAEQWAEQGPWLLLLLLPLAALYFRKGLLVIPLLVLMNYPQDSYAFGWQDLWKTGEQQADQAFRQQQYEQAATQFKSPEWQAAAQHKAENYQQAAQILEMIEPQSADIYYNQATALAKAGQLKPALETYEKALQLNPQHEDALYNKKQVEDALENQKQNKQQDSKDSKKSDKESSNKGQKGQDKQKGDSSKHKQADDQDNNSSNKSQEQPDQDADKAPQESQSESEQREKSKQDIDAAQESAQQQTEIKVSDEQKQAQQQWLKRITDDPSGLLKRKFKYQYNQRNQRSQQEQTW